MASEFLGTRVELTIIILLNVCAEEHPKYLHLHP